MSLNSEGTETPVASETEILPAPGTSSTPEIISTIPKKSNVTETKNERQATDVVPSDNGNVTTRRNIGRDGREVSTSGTMTNLGNDNQTENSTNANRGNSSVTTASQRKKARKRAKTANKETGSNDTETPNYIPMETNFGTSSQKPNEGTVTNDTKKAHTGKAKGLRDNDQGPKSQKGPEKQENKDSELRLPEDHRLAIVYSDDPMKVMTDDLYKALRSTFLTELDAHLSEMPAGQKPPRICWSGNVRGVLRIDCIDQTAVKWVRELMLKPTFNPDGIYAVVQAQSLFAKAKIPKPILRRVTVWIPGENEGTVDFDALMRRIRLLNPTLKTAEWTKFGIYGKDGGSVIAFGIPEEHVKDLEDVECTAFGGLQMLSFRIKRRTESTTK